MTSNANEPHGQADDRESTEDEGATGVEITTSDDEGSTFEPEEDPEGHHD